MKLDEYAALDALGLAQLVKRRQVSPAELAETAARAIAAVNPELGAVIEVYGDRIEALDAKSLGRGPFRGVPFLIKDVGPHLAGRKTEFCSRLCQGMLGEVDSHFATLLKASGVNILGRSNTPEFSMASSSENLLYGNTTTPWKKGYSACGSTGGGAAAVAAGIVPMAHGSDIGGSIRGPASWCGGIGLKPSRGRISSGPLLDEWGYGMAMNFVQTKTMRDTAAMLDCLAIPQPGDPFVIKPPPGRYAGHLKTGRLKPGAKRLRVAWSATALMDSPVDQEVAAAVRRAAETLADLGHEVVEAAPPLDLAQIDEACLGVWFFAFDRRLDGYARKMGRKVGPDTVERGTLRFYEFTKTVAHTHYLDGLAYMNQVRRAMGGFFTRHDIWVTPTTAQVAPRLGVLNMNVDLPPAEFITHEESYQQFLVAYNVTGQPALSLPLGRHSSGLPIGVQLAARPAEDHLLIQLGAALEEAMPWHGRKPEIHVSRH
jgi:amidase